MNLRTKEDIQNYIKNRQQFYKTSVGPIFEILMIENPEKELVGESGKKLGWPDTGASDVMGYFYDLDNAVHSVEENICDIREAVYSAAFVLCRFPGLYETVGPEARMFFRWDPGKQKYVQAPEPKIFGHIAY